MTRQQVSAHSVDSTRGFSNLVCSYCAHGASCLGVMLWCFVGVDSEIDASNDSSMMEADELQLQAIESDESL